eukprot:jgi/Mesvir1/12278/Mv00488-RA.1
MDSLEADVLGHAFDLAPDAFTLSSIASTSREWREIVITRRLWRKRCERECPALEKLIDGVYTTTGNSAPQEWEAQLQESRLFQNILRQVLHAPCGIHVDALAASSTDHPEESIANTTRVATIRSSHQPSYWSSLGSASAESNDWLLYQTSAPLTMIHEIHLRPFKATFQRLQPIYSAKRVRFRLGFCKSPQQFRAAQQAGRARIPLDLDVADGSFVWSYISPEFPMAQEDALQCFKLPSPQLCVGGTLCVELLGKVQTQEFDNLFYICMDQVKVVGWPIPQHGCEVLPCGRWRLIQRGELDQALDVLSMEERDVLARADPAQPQQPQRPDPMRRLLRRPRRTLDMDLDHGVEEDGNDDDDDDDDGSEDMFQEVEYEEELEGDGSGLGLRGGDAIDLGDPRAGVQALDRILREHAVAGDTRRFRDRISAFLSMYLNA